MKRELKESTVSVAIQKSIATLFVAITAIILLITTTPTIPIINSFERNFVIDATVYALLTEPSPSQNTGEKLYENFDLVVVGKITDSSASMADHSSGDIWTYMQVEVEEYLKNSLPTKNLTVKSMGGKVGELGQWVEDSPIFNVGDRALLLLNKDKSINDAYVVSSQSVVIPNGKSSVKNMLPGE